MAKFIKLTCMNNKSIFVNVDYIVHFQQQFNTRRLIDSTYKETSTFIVFHDEPSFAVLETPEEIMKLINKV